MSSSKGCGAFIAAIRYNETPCQPEPAADLTAYDLTPGNYPSSMGISREG